MATGTVKWFNPTKGFSFIQPDDGGQDVFVHISALERAGLRELRDGQKIAYELVPDQRSGKTCAEELTTVPFVWTARCSPQRPHDLTAAICPRAGPYFLSWHRPQVQ